MQSYTSYSELDTIGFAQKIAPQLAQGDILVLSGDLGSGKTKFVQGILSYFHLETEVSSPTFTIVNEYQTSTIPIYHFDVYRIADSDEFYAMGGEEYFSQGICFIEWGEIIQDILPKDYLEIRFSRNEEEETTRVLTLMVHGNFKKLSL